MAVTVNDNVIKHNGNASTLVYGYDFKIFANTDILVLVDGSTWTITTDYTVSGVGEDAGGNISFVAGKAPPSGTNNVIFVGQIPETQATTFADGDKFPATTVNAALDKLTRLIQQHKEILNRCVKVPKDFTSVTFDAELDDPGASGSLGNPFRVASDGLSLEFFTIDSTDTLNVVTTQGDMIFGGSGGTAARFAEGTADGVILYRDSSANSHAKWSVAPTTNAVMVWDSADHVWAYPPDIANNNNPSVPMNFSISVTQASSALTIAFLDKDGNTPSATSPVWMPFRNSTATNGTYTWNKLAAAETLVIPDTANLGGGTGDSIRFYVYGLLNSNDDIEIAAARQAIFDPAKVQSTTAVSITADEIDVLYSTTARTNKPVMLVGVCEATLVGGSWSTVDMIAVWKPGMRKTGDTIQKVSVFNGALSTGTTVTVQDDTKMQDSEGIQFLSRTITPTSALNTIEVQASVNVASSGGSAVIAGLFSDADGTTDALQVMASHTDQGANTLLGFGGEDDFIAGTTGEITLTVRVGTNAGGTITFNGEGGARLYGGALNSYLKAREVYA